MAEKPTRLKIPSVQARSARSVFESEEVLTAVPIVSFLPIVQWTQFRLRILSAAAGTLLIEYCRPAREPADPTSPESGTAYVYTTGQPAAPSVAVVANVEGILDVLATEHIGENWLKVTFTPTGDGLVTFVDASGENVGTYG